MADDKRVDDDLKQFLQWTQQQAREGYTIANLMLRQEQFQGEIRRSVAGLGGQITHLNGRLAAVETDNKDLRVVLDEHGAALVAIKRRVRHGPHDEEMDTGVHQISAIQQRLAEQERKRNESERVKAEDSVWWKRSVIMWVVGGFGFVATTVLTVLVTIAIANSTSPRSVPAPAPVPPSSPSTPAPR